MIRVRQVKGVWRRVLPPLLILALVAWGALTLRAEESTATLSRLLMDTLVDVRVDGTASDKLVERAFALMEDLEHTLSRFVAGSEVSEINRRAGLWTEVSPVTFELIELGLKMGELTAGAFDITIGAVLDLWGFGNGEYRIPNEVELEAALATVDYRKIELDFESKRVRIPSGTVLDLGGIAKGFIVEKATAVLRQGGAARSIINAGGDIAVIGRRPDGAPWRVGVQDPAKPGEIRWVLPLEDRCVVTSGDYQRFFVLDGERWHHLIDAHTGYPARGLSSVTIVGENAAICDALSTAVFVLGPAAGSKLVEDLPGIEAILDGRDGVWISPGLAGAVAHY